MTGQDEPPPKLSRQQLRALAREKRDAEGWITALGTDDLHMKRAIRAALGQRRVTLSELEQAVGMSLEDPRLARVQRD
jgi:hypothetical protein